LAGHISIGDHAIIGGLVGIHQYVRVGAYVMIGGCSAVGRDVPPFMRAAGGYMARLYGVNSIGLKRQGFSNERIAVLKRAYQTLFRSGHRMAEAIIAFLDGTKRGICRSVGKELEDEE
jgi:UDP-N-acetylglucosamine acyltransferase